MLMLALVTALVLASTASAMAHGPRGAVYTQTNDPSGNTVQQFTRGAGGSLSPAGTFATGGIGLDTLGGRQGAVALSGDGRSLYAVNAGSDSVSVFHLGHRGLALLGTVPARGVAPTSVAEDHGRFYVLNSGGTPNVVAFRRWFDGTLRPIRRRMTSLRAPRAPRRSPLRPTAGRWSSASACRTGSRRSRSTASAAPARRW